MIDIIPAVLPGNFAELAEGLRALRGLAPLVQVDVVADIFADAEGLPLWEEFDFEFDVYVEPAAFVPRALALGASSVVVHARHTSAHEALEVLQAARGGEYPVRAGVALRPSDTTVALGPFAGMYDFVQVMGIDNEGHQGEAFDPRATELVAALRAAYPALAIQVDGHAAGHERELAQAGANTLVVGSAIMRAPDPAAAYKDLLSRVNKEVY